MTKPYYDDGKGITIYHDDCRKILPTLPMPHLVIADPPYGMGQADQNRSHRARHDPWMGRIWPPMHDDDRPFDPSHLLHYPRLILFGANHYADRLPARRSWLVWDKRDGSTVDTNADAELIWTNLETGVRVYRQCWRGFARSGEESGQKHLHNTQKPVALMKWLILRFTKAGDLILDPYAGSGPVAVASKQLGRRCISIEIEERSCEAAARRLQQEVFTFDE